VNQKGDQTTQPEGEAFGVNFKAAVLKGNRSEVVAAVGAGLFWKEDDVRLVDRTKVNGKVKEVSHGGKKIALDEVPIVLEKRRSEAIRAGTRIIVHRKKGRANFLEGERPDKRGGLRGVQPRGGNKGGKVKGVRSWKRGAEQVFKEGMKDGRFSGVGENRVSVVFFKNFYLIFAQTPRGA
jgi:hypothetical protein